MEPLTRDDIIQIIREVLAGVGLLIGFYGTIIAALTARRTAIAKERLDSKEQTRKDDALEVELTERLQKLSSDLLAQMESRIAIFQVNQVELERQNKVLREAGIRLIRGIEASIKARSSSPTRTDPETCAACLSGDQALLREVLSVRDLFIKENGNGK